MILHLAADSYRHSKEALFKIFYTLFYVRVFVHVILFECVGTKYCKAVYIEENTSYAFPSKTFCNYKAIVVDYMQYNAATSGIRCSFSTSTKRH